MANTKTWPDPDTHFNGQGRKDMQSVYLLSPSTNKSVEPQSDLGGLNDFHLVSAASNNANNIKNAGGKVYGYDIYNTNAAVRYVKLYNKATAPAPATDNALLIRTIGIPPNGTKALHIAAGMAGFVNGIGLATTTGSSDTDNTSVAAGDLIIEIDWK